MKKITQIMCDIDSVNSRVSESTLFENMPVYNQFADIDIAFYLMKEYLQRERRK